MGGEYLVHASVIFVPVILQRQVPALRLEGSPDSVHRQSSGLQLCFRDVYPQCKLCRRPEIRQVQFLCVQRQGYGSDSAENRIGAAGAVHRRGVEPL